MNLDILFNANLAIQLHVYAALLAFILGVTVLWRRKGTNSHKRWGRIWVGFMVITALTSLFIHEIRLLGPFSPIHLVSIGTLIALYFAVKQARAGQISEHQRSMKGIFIGAMAIAGGMAFMPGRMMFDVALAPTVERIFTDKALTFAHINGWQIPLIVFGVIVAIVFWRTFQQRSQKTW